MIVKVSVGALICAAFMMIIQANAQSYSLWFHYLASDIDSEAEGIVLDVRRDFAGGAGRGPGIVRYHFSYIYYVGDAPYVGYVFSHEGLARHEDVSGKYFKDMPVVVKYDSGSPHYSVIEVRSPGFRMFGAFLPFVAFLVYVLCLWKAK